jgi:hypothetical protein
MVNKKDLLHKGVSGLSPLNARKEIITNQPEKAKVLFSPRRLKPFPVNGTYNAGEGKTLDLLWL